MNKFKVVVLDNRYADYKQERDVLSEIGVEPVIHYPSSDEEACDILQDADGVLCNLYPLTSGLIIRMKKCRVISRYGVGYDNVDVEAASAAGIRVCNVPDYAMEDASDHALALLLACVRKLSYKDRMIRQGRWNLHNEQRCYRMAGKVMGIIGFGHTGRALTRKISGFGFSRILVYAPRTDKDTIRAAGADKAGFDELISESDYISIHCPLNDETRDMINDSVFSRLKTGCMLINTARGPIVNEKALYEALSDGRLAGAGVDVFSTEPLDADSPLRTLDNITLTDHAAWYSEESIVELKTKAARNVLQVLKGEAPDYPVN